MIGPGHIPDRAPGTEPTRSLRALVVTGSRAEFGLLKSVIRAIDAHPRLDLLVVAAGSHLISPAETYRDVKAFCTVADAVPMQIAGRSGRVEDAHALARGIDRFARAFERLNPDWVVVLGDRIEAFAAAAAAAVGGWALAHIHGGDRAEGIADESMRHAITKLANLHLPATPSSGERLVRMGEKPAHVHVVGSPAIDELEAVPPLGNASFDELGRPLAVFLMHPVGRHAEVEEAAASNALSVVRQRFGERVLALHPNHDAGREGVVRAIEQSGVRALGHLERDRFVGLLKLLSIREGVIVGNSSAGLIEAAALRVPAVNIGPRQNGREKPGSVVSCGESIESISAAMKAALAIDRASLTHPYGDGRAGERIAGLLAATDPRHTTILRKLCEY